MIIPQTRLPKALFIVDVQPRTFEERLPFDITERIAVFLQQQTYDAYVVAEYFAPPESMMWKQSEFQYSEAETGPTSEKILTALVDFDKDVLRIQKTNRSCFKSFQQDELRKFLQARQIGEIHFVGFDINDCVLASAYEAIDLGYYSFVLEELCHRYDGDQSTKEAALTILRQQCMTNNSLGDRILFKEI